MAQPIFALSVSLWVSSRGILVVFESAGTLQCARLEFSNPGGPKAAGVSHDSARAHTCTFERPGASNTTKIPREDPREGRKSEISDGRWKRKREISGPPTLQGPHPSQPPPFGAPTRGLLRPQVLGAPIGHPDEHGVLLDTRHGRPPSVVGAAPRANFWLRSGQRWLHSLPKVMMPTRGGVWHD